MSVRKFLAKEAHCPEFGGREVHRVINKYIENIIADALLEGIAGNTIKIGLKNNKTYVY